MSFNPWIHIRLAGGICLLLGVSLNHSVLLLLGWMLIMISLLGGLNRLENLWKEKFDSKKEDDE